MDLLVQVLLLVLMFVLPQAKGFHIIPPKLYLLPGWQLLSFLLHLSIPGSWKVKRVRWGWLGCFIVAVLISPFAIIPGLGLLALLILIWLWPATLLLYWIITIRELVRINRPQ